MKEIKINDDSFIGWEEFYEPCFTCQECGNILFRNFKYCPDCGNKIVWISEHE